MMKNMNTDVKIPIPNNWKQSIRYYLHDKHKLFNTIVLFFTVVAGSFIIFSSSTKTLNEIKEIEVLGIKTFSTTQFIMFRDTIIFSLGIIHGNYILHILYEYIRGKIK